MYTSPPTPLSSSSTSTTLFTFDFYLSMALCLEPNDALSPLETLLTVYSPTLECLVSHLSTLEKLALSQTSRHLRQILHSYPPFLSHLDLRIAVFETAQLDTYSQGTVYNLDRLLQSLPVDGRIVSLTLDWTAVSGYFLFNKILDRCQNTLEHLSVRGCRKVSIKHHIVPHFVYQTSIQPLAETSWGQPRQRPALKSLYVYKARGVRRKPFLIDRKPADGDEPSRYLTSLCADLGIWLDLALCPTPHLRCPRRREILRRGKEKFCVPFDKRWRVVESNDNLSHTEHLTRRPIEQTMGDGITCFNCSSLIPDRCEACVHQMCCSTCNKPFCHSCSYQTPRSAQAEGATTAAEYELLELSAVPSDQLLPCCQTSPNYPNSQAENLCSPCHANLRRAACMICDKSLCIKHEVDRCRRCEGGCNRLFCFTVPESRDPGCGELLTGKAQMRDCLGCGTEVCGSCRISYADNDRGTLLPHSPTSSSPSLDEDDGTSSTGSGEALNGGVELLQKTSCNCRTCLEYYYCPECWPNKPTACIAPPRAIAQKSAALDASVDLYLMAFMDPSHESKWYTRRAIFEIHPDAAEDLLAEFEAREKFTRLSHGILSETPYPAPFEIITDHTLGTLDIQVADHEKILEKVIAVKLPVGPDGAHKPLLISHAAPYPGVSWQGSINPRETMVLCKWLGKNEHVSTSWEKRTDLGTDREDAMVEEFIERCQREQRQGGGSAFLQDEDGNAW